MRATRCDCERDELATRMAVAKLAKQRPRTNKCRLPRLLLLLIFLPLPPSSSSPYDRRPSHRERRSRNTRRQKTTIASRRPKTTMMVCMAAMVSTAVTAVGMATGMAIKRRSTHPPPPRFLLDAKRALYTQACASRAWRWQTRTSCLGRDPIAGRAWRWQSLAPRTTKPEGGIRTRHSLSRCRRATPRARRSGRHRR